VNSLLTGLDLKPWREVRGGSMICRTCNKDKHISKFRIEKGRTKHRSQCKKCDTAESVKRQRAIRKVWQQYLKEQFGTVCPHCGFGPYPENAPAFDLHHLDASQKEFNFNVKLASVVYTSPKAEEVKDEINKCILLCSNCHRLLHANLLPSRD
jgi:hypothetical protein